MPLTSRFVVQISGITLLRCNVYFIICLAGRTGSIYFIFSFSQFLRLPSGVLFPLASLRIYVPSPFQLDFLGYALQKIFRLLTGYPRHESLSSRPDCLLFQHCPDRINLRYDLPCTSCDTAIGLSMLKRTYTLCRLTSFGLLALISTPTMLHSGS